MKTVLTFLLLLASAYSAAAQGQAQCQTMFTSRHQLFKNGNFEEFRDDQVYITISNERISVEVEELKVDYRVRLIRREEQGVNALNYYQTENRDMIIVVNFNGHRVTGCLFVYPERDARVRYYQTKG